VCCTQSLHGTRDSQINKYDDDDQLHATATSHSHCPLDPYVDNCGLALLAKSHDTAAFCR